MERITIFNQVNLKSLCEIILRFTKAFEKGFMLRHAWTAEVDIGFASSLLQKLYFT